MIDKARKFKDIIDKARAVKDMIDQAIDLASGKPKVSHPAWEGAKDMASKGVDDVDKDRVNPGDTDLDQFLNNFMKTLKGLLQSPKP